MTTPFYSTGQAERLVALETELETERATSLIWAYSAGHHRHRAEQATAHLAELEAAANALVNDVRYSDELMVLYIPRPAAFKALRALLVNRVTP